MKSGPGSPRRSGRPAERDGLPSAERAELQRQGAKAAARGDETSENPMTHPSNLPTSTGESRGLWQKRKDAWQSGHDAQSKADDKAEPFTPNGSAKDEH
ncbi:CrpP-related protein [Roseateles chitosanitabidus]|uniref:CrpP-related protein n=1 Tax=Roseateles chitosanitabidus TaxID=65048 RepID=UPI00273A28A4|nr:CrpP-related protein [Roseateles chitosanitabidus]